MQEREKVPGTCPHCGRQLSPWEQVLLSVDRAIMCKGCWYRIILDAFENRLTDDAGHPHETRD